jgi:hypothetical protein
MWCSWDGTARYTNPRDTLIFALAIYIIAHGLALGVSYNNYLGMKQREATIEQNASAVLKYASAGVGSFTMGQMISNEITDFKFGQFQDNMGGLIVTMRNEIQEYNKVLIGKQTMKRGDFFSNWVYLPDEYLYVEPMTMAAVFDEVSPPAEEEKTMDPEADKEPASDGHKAFRPTWMQEGASKS